MNPPTDAAAPRRLPLCLTLVALGLAACSDGGGSMGVAAPAEVFANPVIEGADVGWQPTDDTLITSYTVTLKADGHTTKTQSVPAPASGLRVLGLDADTDYAVTVQATDAGTRVSAASAAASVHTPRTTNTSEETDRYTAAAEYSREHDGDAVLIMRDGQVVFERYPSSYVRSSAHVLASGSKSFSCSFMLAAEKQQLLTRDEKVSNSILEWKNDPNKSQITVRQLLSLQSGLSTNPDYSPVKVPDIDTYQLAIDDPANFPPGEAFIYDPLAFQAFALMFERKTADVDPVAFLQDKVFSRIGLTGDEWQRDAEGHPQMAGGASMTAEAWARYGQLFLQGGTWQAQRVLPAEGVTDCLTYDNKAYLGYGITWWLNRPVQGTYDPSVDMIPPDGIAGGDGQIAPRVPANMYMAAGTGHQRLYVLPTQRLVVVRFAPLETELDEWSDDEFLARLLGTMGT